MITILMLCVAGIVLSLVATLILTLIGIPLLLIGSIVPWILVVAGVVALVKALMEKPLRWENLLPGVGLLILSGLLRWLF